MPIGRKLYLWTLGALLWIVAWAPAGAQPVYQCGPRNAPVYTEKPCSGRMVSTQEAPVAAKLNPKELDLRRLEENRVMARALRLKPDETAEQFDTRRRRTAMLDADRAECARIDTRMPVEAASLTNPDPAEVAKADDALKQSRKRFGELRC